MSGTTIVLIAVAALVVLAVVMIAATSRRRDATSAGELSREARQRDTSSIELESAAAAPTGRELELAAARARSEGEIVPATSLTPSPWSPPDAETMGVTRRQFFNRSLVALMGLSLATFGAAVLAFLWPKLSGGFGSKITVGKIDDIKAEVRAGKGFFYLPEGRAWITEFPKADLAKAKKAYPTAVYNGMAAGLNALYQKCPHLGCRVPNCDSSQWFECPCHGSQYNQVGEKKGGPAPRGMDRFGLTVDAIGTVTIDTGTVFPGPPIGTNTTGQEAEGPHCINSGGEKK